MYIVTLWYYCILYPHIYIHIFCRTRRRGYNTTHLYLCIVQGCCYDRHTIIHIICNLAFIRFRFRYSLSIFQCAIYIAGKLHSICRLSVCYICFFCVQSRPHKYTNITARQPRLSTETFFALCGKINSHKVNRHYLFFCSFSHTLNNK